MNGDLGPNDPGDELPPLSGTEREETLADVEDVAGFRALLEHKGVRGLVLDCPDCGSEHYFSWDLLEENLRGLLVDGQPRVHEPAFSVDPNEYVSWDYARGYADAVLDAGEDEPEPDRAPGRDGDA